MKIEFSRYQKWVPVGLLGVFLVSSLFFVAVPFKPTQDLSVSDGKVIPVRSRSEAEVEVYKRLPYKASFVLTTGEAFKMDLRYLGFSYFSEKELERLDMISAKSFWGKFRPFFSTEQKQLISVYPQRSFWLKPLEETIKNQRHLLKQEPQTNHLVADPAGSMTVSEAVNGYEVDEKSFVDTVYQIGKTGKFDSVPLESRPLYPEDQSALLAQYPNLVQKLEIAMPDDFAASHNIETAQNRLQNIYIGAGETVDISALMGKLTTRSGYLPGTDGQPVGSGTEQLIDTIKEIADSQMTVKSYKGKFITIGDPGKGLTQLTVENTTGRDMVFSLAIQSGTLSVILAAK